MSETKLIEYLNYWVLACEEECWRYNCPYLMESKMDGYRCRAMLQEIKDKLNVKVARGEIDNLVTSCLQYSPPGYASKDIRRALCLFISDLFKSKKIEVEGG